MGASAMEKVFRFLFKYPPLMFQQGDFTWGLSRPVLLIVVAAIAVAGAALLTYRGLATAHPPARGDIRQRGAIGCCSVWCVRR